MLMNESQIIMALNEAKKKDEGEVIGEPVYSCPDCGAMFTIDGTIDEDNKDDVVKCPECGDVVHPKLESDDGSDLGDDEDEAMIMHKAKTVVRNGKKMKIKAHRSKKLTGKALAARRKALKKARRKANTGAAKHKRAKSMKKRSSMGLNSSYHFDENVAMDMLNGVLDDITEADNNLQPINIKSVNSATYNAADDTIYVDTTVTNCDEDDTATFEISGFKSGNLVVTEPEMFEGLDIAITGKGYFTGNEAVIDEMSVVGETPSGEIVNESYQAI